MGLGSGVPIPSVMLMSCTCARPCTGCPPRSRSCSSTLRTSVVEDAAGGTERREPESVSPGDPGEAQTRSLDEHHIRIRVALLTPNNNFLNLNIIAITNRDTYERQLLSRRALLGGRPVGAQPAAEAPALEGQPRHLPWGFVYMCCVCS